jgi:hypothetical protein
MVEYSTRIGSYVPFAVLITLMFIGIIARGRRVEACGCADLEKGPRDPLAP